MTAYPPAETAADRIAVGDEFEIGEEVISARTGRPAIHRRRVRVLAIAVVPNKRTNGMVRKAQVLNLDANRRTWIALDRIHGMIAVAKLQDPEVAS